MAVGINEGLGGTGAESFTWDVDFPVVDVNNDTFQFRWHNWIAKVAIENLQSKVLQVTGDATGNSTIFDSDDIPVELTLTLEDTAATPGSYPLASLTVDSKGRITAINDVTANYVLATGGVFSGIVTGEPVTGGSPGEQFATKNYVDLVGGGGAGTFVLTDGSLTMSAPLEYDALVITSNDDQVPNIGEVKNYILPITNALLTDKVEKSGDTMTGTLEFSGAFLDGIDMGTKRIIQLPLATFGTEPVTRDFGDIRYFQFAGGTMTGALILDADPVVPLGAATKQYVDTAVLDVIDAAPAVLDTLNELAAAIGDDANFATTITTSIATKVPLAGGTMLGPLFLDANPTLNLHAATKNYVDTELADRIKQDGTIAMAATLDMGTNTIINVVDPTNPQDAATKAYTDLHVELSGDTMIGALILNADPLIALGAATKGYVDTNFINIDGTVSMAADLDAGTNKIVNVVDPTNAQDAATKAYVDLVGTAGVAVLADGTVPMVGALNLGVNLINNVVDPVGAQDAATKNYADLHVKLAGSTMLGPLILDADPAVALGAATKDYVDTEIMTAGALWVNVDGTSIMTGSFNAGSLAIVAVADPVNPQEAATKAYVDSAIPIDHIKQDGTIAMTATLDLGTNLISNVVDPVALQDAATKAYVDTSVSDLVDAAPAALDTLNELAAALGDDPNFATTLATAIGAKVTKAGDTMIGPLILDADPAIALGAATKDYVDTSVAAVSTITTFESAPQTITSAGQIVAAHGLSSTPKSLDSYLICTTAEFNYLIGDKVWHTRDGAGGVAMVFDGTNITVRYANVANVFQTLNKTTGDIVSLTNSSWDFVVIAHS